jgi:hypothetical protein
MKKDKDHELWQYLELTIHLNQLNEANSQEEFDFMVSNLTCADCLDFKEKACEGKCLVGEEVLHCVLDKADYSEFGHGTF